MNILLVNHYAGTLALGMEYRPYHLAKEWVRLGHRVTIAAADLQPATPKSDRVLGVKNLSIAPPAVWAAAA